MKMKSVIMTVFLTVIALIILPLLNQDDHQVMSSSAGAAAQYTGSPGDGRNCKSCHAGPAAATQAGWIASNIPASGYVPNTTYTITATATGPGHSKFGFQVSPQNSTGTLLGTLTVTSAQTQTVGSGKYVTHTSTGTSGTGSKSWSFNWTAPAAGVSNVTFYGAFNLTNSSNSSSGDTIVLSTLSVSQVLIATANVTSNVTCNSGANGSASVTVSGGTQPYTYVWNTTPAMMTSSVNGLGAGIYSVTVTDGVGATTSSSVIISQPTAINAFVISQTNVSCNGASDGTATVNASGGTGVLTYAWQTSPVQTGATATGLTAQTFSVIVSDANGCTTSTSVSLTQPAAITAQITTVDVTCNGGSSGTATATANGGAGSYAYQWNTIPIQNTPGILGLSSGTYTVTVTDANNCSQTSSTTVTEPSALMVAIDNSNPTVCSGNCVTLNAIATGGTGSSYTYSWNAGDIGSMKIACANDADLQYIVFASDANNCFSSDTVDLTVFQSPNVSLNLPADTFCSNGSDVTLNATPSGGFYSGTGITSNIFSPSAAGNGSYVLSYTFTDANQCTVTDSELVQVEICFGLTEIESQVFKMYPNPVKGILYLETGEPDYTVSIVDISGKNVLLKKASGKRMELDLSFLNPGMYYVSVQTSSVIIRSNLILAD